MRFPSFSTLMTFTRTCCPTETNSFGSVTRRRLISETCSRPSTPPRSMKAPNGVRVFTVPVSSAPGAIAFRVSSARAEGAEAADIDVEAALVPSRHLSFHRQAIFVHLPQLIETGFPARQFSGDPHI